MRRKYIMNKKQTIKDILEALETAMDLIDNINDSEEMEDLYKRTRNIRDEIEYLEE
jgi:hypothetical protein